MIDGVVNSDAIPVLERMMQFAGRRHRLLAHNIANLDTPGFRPVDVSVDAFQAQLGKAVDDRREENGNRGGTLAVDNSREISFDRNGLSLHPRPTGENILFHDENDRDAERIMQSLVENFMTFRTAADLLKSRLDIINTAIRERI